MKILTGNVLVIEKQKTLQWYLTWWIKPCAQINILFDQSHVSLLFWRVYIPRPDYPQLYKNKKNIQKCLIDLEFCIYWWLVWVRFLRNFYLRVLLGTVSVVCECSCLLPPPPPPHTHTHTHRHRHTHMQRHTNIHTYRHTHTQMMTCTHTHTQRTTCTHTYHTHTHTHTLTHCVVN